MLRDPGLTHMCDLVQTGPCVRVSALLLMTVSATAVFVYIWLFEPVDNAQFTVTRPKISFNVTARSRSFDTESVLSLSLSFLVCTFFCLSAIGQGVVLLLVDVWDSARWNNREAALNAAISSRMVEYSVSAPVMLVCIALLCHIRDAYTLLGMFLSLQATNVIGLCVHHLLYYGNGDRVVAWFAHVSSWVVCFLGYSPILFSFGLVMKDIEFDLKPLVVAIVALEAVLFFGFGLVQLFDLCSFPFRAHPYMLVGGSNTPRLERMAVAYDLLSLTAKLFLGWAIMGPVFQGGWKDAAT